jgi:hypothetical protein
LGPASPERTSWDRRDEAQFINVEEKRRDFKFITKLVTKVSPDDYTGFAETGTWGETDDPILQRFEARIKVAMLRPVLLVEYRREIYEIRLPPKVRVSFDHSMRYCASNTLFPPTPLFQDDLSNSIIMEIKTTEEKHPWLHELVRRVGLKSVPNSKYANGIDLAAHAVCR